MDPSYLDMLQQLGLQDPNQATQGALPPITPPGATPYTPFDTSTAPGTAFGAPYGGPLGLPTPAPAPASTNVSRQDLNAPATNDMSGGFAPAPRQDLPRMMTRPKNAATFGAFDSVYNPPQSEDPLAGLLPEPQPLPGQPLPADQNRALIPPWMQQAAGPQYGAGVIDRAAQQAGPSPGEQALLRKNPAYGRAIDRIRLLDRVRNARQMGGMGGPMAPPMRR